VETAQDVLDELKLQGVGRVAQASDKPEPASGPHRKLLAAMGRDPVAIDQLASRSGLSAEAIAAGLVELALEGRVAAMPGGHWQRLS
jgi:DNA processing protein